MLQELRIQDFAIIDDLQLTFGPGLNILTGETGAGKSIIIDAIGLLLGDRASADWVRAGSELATVEATFQLPPRPTATADNGAEVRDLLAQEALEDADNPDWVVLGREVRLNGRNVCRINGRNVTLQLLADVAGHLVDIHGQGEHLNLLRPRTHALLLDRFAGLLPLRSQVALEVGALRQQQAELQRLRQDARAIAQRLDMLSFQSSEIEAAQLQVGEDEQLGSERRRLSNAEALLTLAQAAQSILSEGDGELPGAVDLVSEAVGRLDRLARIDPEMRAQADTGQALLEQLSDLSRDLQDYADSLEFNPNRLVEVEERLELIAHLQRKYGDTIPDILAFGAQAEAELAELANWEVKTTALETELESRLQSVGDLGSRLSAARRTAGAQMAAAVEQELDDLKMARARFQVELDQSPTDNGAYLPDGRRVAFDASGIDRVEFLISANPGEPLKPLARVASGGETARLMLALKSVLAHADATPTLIFDEIDQGIGGRVGGTVGQKLWQLTVAADIAPTAEAPAAPLHQVLCITHLPQLAAFGDRHFTVNKQVRHTDDQERTTTVVRHLSDADQIQELMQMLGATTAAGRRSVEEMLAAVAASKAKGVKDDG